MLGDIESKPWDYRTLPNKMLELVKNVGDMQQEGTGYSKALENQEKGHIKIRNHAKVLSGNLHYDHKDRER